MQMKSTLIHIDNYEKKIFDRKNNLNKATGRRSTQEKPLNFLRSEKVNGLKILRSIIYVQEYFYMFLSTLKDIIQAQSKTNQ